MAKAKIPPLIVTLGTLSIALGLAQIITGGLDIRAVPDSLTDTIGYGRVLGIPMLSLIALIVVVIGGIVLHKTKFGRYTYAIGSNEEATRRVGVKVYRHLIKIYAMTGFLAGFAGILSLSQYGTTTIAGQSLTNLNVIAAVVIGGTSIFGGEGSIFGTVVGLFIPAVLLSGFTILGVTPYWQTVAVGSVLIAAVYIDQSRRAAASRGAKPSLLGAVRQEEVAQQFRHKSSPVLPQPLGWVSAEPKTGRKAMKRSTLTTVSAGALAVLLAVAGCSSSKPEASTSAAAASTAAAVSGSVAAPTKAAKDYNVSFMQGVAGDEFYISMQCGIEAEAKKLGVTVNTQGPQKFDPTLQKPIVDSVVASQAGRPADRPDRRRGHATPPAGRRCRRHQGGAGRHHRPGPVVRRVPGGLGQRGRRGGRVRRDQGEEPERRQGPGHLHRPRHLHRRRPGQGLRNGRRRRFGVQLRRRAVLAQRPGHRRPAGDRGPAEGPRHRRHLRHQPVRRRGHRNRRQAGRQG